MMGGWPIAAALALPFVAAVVLRLAPGERSARLAGAFATLVSLTTLVLLLPDLIDALHGDPTVLVHPWIPTLDIAFALNLDGLGGLFALLVTGIGTVVFAYAAGYMDGMDRIGPFFATMLAFEGSMLGVVLADDVLLLFLFWELTSLTSFLLIGYHHEDPDSVYSSRKAMIITVSGGVAMFAGFLALAMLAGTFRVGALLDATPAGHPLVPVTMGLIVAGAATKAAQFPFHIWLPNAMVAPTPVSSYLHSAAMVKAGIYLLARVRPLFAPLPSWQVGVTALGLGTMLLTAVLALGQTDPKKLLAYSTCSQLGLIVAALGLLDGAAGAVLHVAHHAVFKCGLFLAAGVAIHAFHAKDMSGMGDLARTLPFTAAATLFLALASAGIPPFSAFVSKELILETAIHTGGAFGWTVAAGLAVASMFTVAYSLRFYLGIFAGDTPDEAEVEVPALATRAPVLLLGGLALAGGVVPSLWEPLVEGGLAGAATGVHAPHLALWHGVTPTLGVSAVVIAVGAALVRTHPHVTRFVEGLKERSVRVRADHIYHALLDACQASAFRVGRIVQRETPQAYVAYTLVLAAGLALGGLWTAGVRLPAPVLAVGPLLLLVMGLVAVAALVVTQARSYTLGVIALGVVGLLVGLLYLLLGAPDVGLTQLLVETLLLALFVAILARLPPSYIERDRWPVRIRDAAVAALVGATVTVLVLVATSPTPFARVGPQYFVDLVERTGGHNAVNVILVDFRALDTLGEITVVAIAGLAAVTLVQNRFRGWLR